MAAALARRTVLLSGATVLARPFLARAQAGAPGMSIEDLLAIGQDDRGMMDALTVLLWRAGSLREILQKAGMPALKVKYAVNYADGGPAAFDPDTIPNFFFFNDRLAVALACDVIGSYAAYQSAVNATEAAKAAEAAIRTPPAVRSCQIVYRRLLNQTRSSPEPGAPTLGDYVRESAVWGPQLAATATSDAFFASTNLLYLSAPDEARRFLNLTLYKIAELAPAKLGAVAAAWRAPALADTVFPIAVRDPRPENFYARFRNGGPNPMAPLIGNAAALSRDAGSQQCHSLDAGDHPVTKCEWHSLMVYGEPVWRLVQQRASAYGWLADPHYPGGYAP